MHNRSTAEQRDRLIAEVRATREARDHRGRIAASWCRRSRCVVIARGDLSEWVLAGWGETGAPTTGAGLRRTVAEGATRGRLCARRPQAVADLICETEEQHPEAPPVQ
jgi:hypothetical protein